MTHTPPTPEAARPEMEIFISPHDRIKLGDNEFAICGEISLANQGIYLLDVGFSADKQGRFGPYDIDGSGQKRTFEKPYVLVTRMHGGGDDEGEGKAKGEIRTFEFDPEEEIVIGRRGEVAEALGLISNEYISRRHATLKVDKRGTAEVKDVGSTNPITVRTAKEIFGNIDTDFGYSINFDEDVHRAGRGHLLDMDTAGWGYGEYAGRPVIARDTPINGGVYPVGGRRGEALVIDDRQYPVELNALYREVTKHMDSLRPDDLSLVGLAMRKFYESESPDRHTRRTLETVFVKVSDALKYDKKATNAIARDYEKVAINEYIRAGVGVCRTQAVLSAYAIERLIIDSRLAGSVSIDRNMKHEVDGTYGGHAWARFRDENGVVYIIDPAQRHVGKLKDLVGKPGSWEYRRSEDLMQEVLDRAV